MTFSAVLNSCSPVLKTACALVAALAITAAPSAAFAKDDISIWHTLKGPSAKAFSDLVEDFNQQNLDSHIALKAFASADELKAQLKEGKLPAPQWVQWSAGNPDDLYGAKPNSFEIVQEFLGAKSPLSGAASAAATAPFRNSKGKWVALPLTAAVPVVMYRADAFEKVGLPLVTQFSDWRELQNAAYKLRDSGFSCGIASPNPAWVHMENLSAWHSQPYTTKDDGADGDGGQYAFNSLMHVRHMALIMSWVKSDLLMTGDSEKALQAWGSGKCPILLGPSTAFGEVPESQRSQIVITQMPLWDEVAKTQGKLFPNGDGLYLIKPANADQKKAAAAFSAYWFKPDVAARWHQKTGAVPLTLEAQASTKKTGFYERIPGWGVISEKLAAVKSTLIKPFHFAKRQQVLNAGDKEIVNAFDSGKAAKAVLDDSVASANAITGAGVADTNTKAAKAKR
ncbi:MAG: extracellular solute-binding protein [Burkholderiales bacterium]|nr:extracellular solute-binding protein [Burkholderiales bacterium]